MTQPIGILGGTFDPVHFGHLRTALEIQEILNLQEVRFIPCQMPVHKDKAHASPAQRLAMLNIALEGQAGFICDDRELTRNTPSYMLETLQSLRKEMPQTPLCLILGTDAFNGLDTWHQWEKLTNFAHIILVLRGNTAFNPTETLGAWLKEHKLDDPQGLYDNSAGYCYVQNITQLEISATHIRSQLAAGISPRYLLPDVVLNYIHEQGLYQSP